MDPAQINWFAVLAATLWAFVLGGLWYSPLMFYKPWLGALGGDEAALRAGAGRVFAGAIACAAIASVNLAFFIGPKDGVAFGAFAGFAAGFGWVATGLCTTYLFERRPARLILIDAGYHVVSLTGMGALLGLWR